MSRRKEKRDVSNMAFRAFAVQPGSTRAVISSEKPVPMFDWEMGEMIPEILLSSGMEIRGGGDQVVMLDSHSRWSVDTVLGSVRNIRAKGEVIEGDPEFGSDTRSKDAEAKVEEGHISDLSVGYQIDPKRTVYVGEDEEAEIDGRKFKGPANVRTWWLLNEVSLVPIGANDEAKLRGYPSLEEARRQISEHSKQAENGGAGAPESGGAGASRSPTEPGAEKQNQPQIQQTRTMSEEISTPVAVAEPPAKPELSAEERELAIRKAGETEVKRIHEIREASGNFAEANPAHADIADKIAARHIEERKSLDEFRKELEFVKENYTPIPLETDGAIDQAHRIDNMSEQEAQQYSLLRAINLLEQGKPLDGLEREASDEIAAKVKSPAKGFYVPMGNLKCMPGVRQMTEQQRADLDSTTATTAAELVGVQHRPQDMIELLRNRMVTAQAGVRSLNIDSGTISIPRQDTGAAFGWVLESGSLSESNLTTGEVTATGKEGGMSQTYTKKLLAQGTPSVEQLVRDDLVDGIAVGKDLGILEGSGAAGQPTGIKNTGSIGAVTFGATPTWAKMLEFIDDVATANALMGSLSYMFNAGAWAALSSIEKATNTAKFIIDENDTIAGYPYFMTEQISSDFVAFGNWRDTFMVDWGGIDIVVNPFSDDLARRIRVTAFITTDVIVRHPASYSWSSDAATQ